MRPSSFAIKGTTRLAGVIGWPIHHSLSPVMQNAGFRHLGLDVVYVPMGVPPQGLKDLLRSLKALNCMGVNVTIPYKEKVITLLDELDETAARIGAVNTIVFEDNRTKGYNTDASGFVTAVQKRIKIKGKNAVLLGGGGAGRAVAMSLVLHGASHLTVAELESKKRRRLHRDIMTLNTGVELQTLAPESAGLQTALTQADLIVNATPLGLRPSDPLPLPKAWIPNHRCVMDLAYGRGLTKLLTLARQKRNTIIPGWEMLLYQGTKAFTLWSKRPAPIDVMARALTQAAGIKR